MDRPEARERVLGVHEVRGGSEEDARDVEPRATAGLDPSRRHLERPFHARLGVELVMSPSTTATRSFSADSATRSLARSSMGAELSTATATAPGHSDATAVECHAGPAPNSSNDAIGRPVPPARTGTRGTQPPCRTP